jgi:polyhydroxyalkanoate synthase
MTVFDWFVWCAGGVLGALVLLYSWVRLTWPTAPQATVTAEVTTPDGHILPLYHHAAQGGAPKATVLCLHGLGASHFNFNFPGPANLAAWLAQRGYDVWVTSLRGDYDARPPTQGDGDGYSFDLYVQRDLPAVMAEVRKRSGSTHLHLLGHSMGGLLSYAWVAAHGDAGLASICAIASPVGFEEKGAVMDHRTQLEGIIRALRWAPIRTLARVGAPWLWLTRHSSVIRKQFNVDNMVVSYTQRAMFNALSNVPRGVMLQFADWIKEDAFRSADALVDYREGLRRLTVPLCVIAGSVDQLARPSNTMRAFQAAPSTVKKAITLGRQSGCLMDYGHIDLLFGERAPAEVFPHVLAFLETAQADVLARKGNGHHV